jgi:hypothetical protein
MTDSATDEMTKKMKDSHEFIENLNKAKTAISNLEKFSRTQAASDELVNAGLALDNFQNEILKPKGE